MKNQLRRYRKLGIAPIAASGQFGSPLASTGTTTTGATGTTGGTNNSQNVNIGDYPEFALVANSRFGVLIESLGNTPAQIVVERATYSNDANGTVWAAGSNSLASLIQQR